MDLNGVVALRAVAVTLAAAVAGGSRSAGQVLVEVRTEVGAFVVEVDTVHAPVTSANFLRYVDAGAYSGGSFHRTVRADNQPTDPVKIDVVQASRTRGFDGFDAIPLERTTVTGLRHEVGTISMARAGPDTATSDFFICIGPQPELDYGGARNPDGQGFAAFGRVVSGMDVVRRIHEAPADGQRLSPRIGVVGIERTQARGAGASG
jgi:peptidyl-prolyl cis-trans isomerase A (cyclophilin A)